MYQPNIISAGRMMAFVLMLFGMLHFGSAFIPSFQENPEALPDRFFPPQFFYSLISGIVLFLCGTIIAAMLGKVNKKPSLGTPILIVGLLVFVYGAVCAGLLYRNPFAWMTALLSFALFVDIICLKVDIDRTKKAVL